MEAKRTQQFGQSSLYLVNFNYDQDHVTMTTVNLGCGLILLV